MPLALGALLSFRSVFAQVSSWFTSGFDYVRFGHVVLRRILSLVAIVAIFVCLHFVPRLPSTLCPGVGAL